MEEIRAIVELYEKLKDDGIAQIICNERPWYTLVISWRSRNYIREEYKEDKKFLFRSSLYRYLLDYITKDKEKFTLLKYNEAKARNGIVTVGDHVVYETYGKLLEGWIQKFSNDTVHLTYDKDRIGKTKPDRHIQREYTHEKIWKL